MTYFSYILLNLTDLYMVDAPEMIPTEINMYLVKLSRHVLQVQAQ